MAAKIIFLSLLLMILAPTSGIVDAAGAVTSGTGRITLSSEGQFAQFIEWLFPALLMTCAILAMFMIVIAGVEWVTAYGNPSKIEDARDRIYMAILGLILAFAAWLILNTINPALVNPTIFK